MNEPNVLLSADELRAILLEKAMPAVGRPRRVLVIHPDYSRNDFTHLLVPMLHELLSERGLERLDTLNAAGTHRRMDERELRAKLGLDPAAHGRVGRLCNHDYDDPDQLVVAG